MNICRPIFEDIKLRRMRTHVWCDEPQITQFPQVGHDRIFQEYRL